MNEQQIEQAAKTITEMVCITSLMAATPNDQDVPGFMVSETGRTFTESLADLAELIGGTDFRNNTLLDAVNLVSQMEKTLEEVGIL